MIDLLASLPLWLLAAVLTLMLVGTGLAALYAARRWLIPWMKLRYEDAYVGAVVVQSVMVLYSLVAALIAVGVWTKYTQVEGTISAEATAIASLWRDLGSYPEPTRTEAREILRGYTHQVIHGAWPQQRQGKIPREGVEWMNRLQATLFAFEPQSEGKKISHGEALRAFNTMVTARRQRVDAVNTGLPGVLWFVLLPGALGCVLLSVLFKVDNAWYQGVLVASLAGFLSMILFVIITLDRPLQGDMAIGPGSYQLIYDQLMKN
jgi:hypothetical protein